MKLKEMLQNLDASLRLQSSINAPDHAFIGPSVAELAIQRIDELEEELAQDTKIKEVDLTRLSLQPGEVLVLTIKSDELNHDNMTQLRTGMEKYFPNNKILVLGVGESGSIDLTVASTAAYPNEVKGCGPAPTDYCATCSCGKKEAFERKNE